MEGREGREGGREWESEKREREKVIRDKQVLFLDS